MLLQKAARKNIAARNIQTGYYHLQTSIDNKIYFYIKYRYFIFIISPKNTHIVLLTQHSLPSLKSLLLPEKAPLIINTLLVQTFTLTVYSAKNGIIKQPTFAVWTTNKVMLT